MSIEYCLKIINSPNHTKAAKEAALRAVREHERQTGEKIIGNYNK